MPKDMNQAKEIFRRNTTLSSYRDSFGDPPKAAEDFVVMRQKKFSNLEISKFILPHAINYIEKWINMNNKDEFIKRVYFTLREVHTIIKN